jgi:hypothetical protein
MNTRVSPRLCICILTIGLAGHTAAAIACAARDKVPDGLAAGDWTGIRAAYEATRPPASAGPAGQPQPPAAMVNSLLARPPAAQVAYLKASNAEGETIWPKDEVPGDHFGTAVAADGDTVVVGAPYEDGVATGVNGDQADNSAPYAGAAYVFVRDGNGGWIQQAYLKASNTEAYDHFGLSVAISGDTAVVGAPYEWSSAAGVNGDQADNSAYGAGAAYVFVRDANGNWNQQAYLKASNPNEGDYFGLSLAISGDTIVVGAPYEDSSATGVNGNQADNSAETSGAAYVFVRDANSVWSQQAYLKASNTDAYDSFGYSVAISGDTIVVGAGGEGSSATGVNGDQADNSAAPSGAAYAFVRNGGMWSQQAYLKASNTGVGDAFGGSVGISGDTIIVGAPREASSATGVNGNQADDSATWAGAAYVFVSVGGVWSQQAYLKSSNTESVPFSYGDLFGGSVAIADDIIVVGALRESSSATGVNGDQADNSAGVSGAAYFFVRAANGVWSQRAYLKASNTNSPDIFGVSVAVSGDLLAVGAPQESSGATGVNGDQADNSEPGAGAAYLFTLFPNPVPSPAALSAE